MKKFAWFKHPNDLSNDKRLSALIDHEGGRGYGTYLYIIETLHIQPDGKLSFQQLNTMNRKGFGKAYMRKIIQNYKLFIIKGEEFESTISYNSPAKDSMETAPNLPDNSQETDEELPENKETLDKNKEMGNDDNSQNSNNKEGKPGFTRVRGDKSREEQRREDENRNNDFVVEKNGDDDGELQAAQNAMPPFRPWRELIDSLAQDSEWKDRVCMTSGFSSLLSRRFKEALEIFKDHVLLHGKEKSIDSPEEARNYFNNYTKEQRTSQALHAALLALDANQPSATPPDPHRYEQLVNGRRTYPGCPIPTGRDRFLERGNAFVELTKHRTQAPKTPHLSGVNATPERLQCHTSARPMPHFVVVQVWHRHPRNVASRALKCGISKRFLKV